MEIHLQNSKKMMFSGETSFNNGIPNSSAETESAGSELPKVIKCHSQPILHSSALEEAVSTGCISYHPGVEWLKDRRFDTFKTWSWKLDRQTPIAAQAKNGKNAQNLEIERLPADRYFDALEGPELDTLRVCNVSFFYCSFFPSYDLQY